MFPGVLLACFLVFTSRMSADQAILFVRAKRPNSIQTRGQLLCVREFARFVAPLHCVFSTVEPRAHAVTLSQYLARQRHLLHGYEARHMKHVPKIIHLVCRLLLAIAENKHTAEEKYLSEIPDLTAEVEKTISQQALQQLGKEMRGKGILLTSPHSFQSSTPPPEQFENENYVKAQILRSFSDSALHTLGSRFKGFRWHTGVSNLLSGHCVSQSRLAESPDINVSRPLLTAENCISSKPDSLVGSSASLDELKREVEHMPPSVVCRQQIPLRETKRSRSLGFSRSSGAITPMLLTEEKLDQSNMKPERCQGTCTASSNNPFLLLQTELSPEVRRVLVAKALMMDVKEENLRNAILMWQVQKCPPAQAGFISLNKNQNKISGRDISYHPELQKWLR